MSAGRTVSLAARYASGAQRTFEISHPPVAPSGTIQGRTTLHSFYERGRAS